MSRPMTPTVRIARVDAVTLACQGAVASGTPAARLALAGFTTGPTTDVHKAALRRELPHRLPGVRYLDVLTGDTAGIALAWIIAAVMSAIRPTRLTLDGVRPL